MFRRRRNVTVAIQRKQVEPDELLELFQIEREGTATSVDTYNFSSVQLKFRIYRSRPFWDLNSVFSLNRRVESETLRMLEVIRTLVEHVH
jgi:hypothetical protein